MPGRSCVQARGSPSIIKNALPPLHSSTLTTCCSCCLQRVRHTSSFPQCHDMRWLPTPSFLLSTTTSALRFSPPAAFLRRPTTLLQQQGLLALGLVRPFSLLHHQQLQSTSHLSSLRLRAHSTAASTTIMATREEKDRYVCFWKEDGVFVIWPPTY